MSGEDAERSEDAERPEDPERQFGPPDEHLREALERELGEVPPESPSEPPEEVAEEGEGDERKRGKEGEDCQ